MNLIVKTISTTEPLTLSEVKMHLGMAETDTYWDSYLPDLIKAARERAEVYTQRSLVDKTMVLMLDGMPRASVVKLPSGPIKSVTSIKYKKENQETLEILPASDYHVQSAVEPGYIYFLKRVDDIESRPNAVQIEYTTGYGSRTVSGVTDPNPLPAPLKSAMLMIVRTMFDFRDDLVKGTIVARVPQNAEYLMAPYRIYEFL